MTTCAACGVPTTRRVCTACIARFLGGPTEQAKPVEPEIVEQTVMAQRLWRWLPGEGLKGMRKLWKSGFMEASCSRGHESPHWTDPEAYGSYPFTIYGSGVCLCGVNAYKLTHLFGLGDLSWARGVEYKDLFTPSMTEALPVLGIVELGGEVHEYEFGYRAQYARIVEGTVLTSLPLDQSFVAELEEQYDAPFRVQSYDDWKMEWEATYGRDRETEETDSGSETTSSTAPGAVTYHPPKGAGQTTSHLAQQVMAQQTAALARQWSSMFFDAPPTRWERFKESWRRDWRLGKDLVFLRLSAYLLALGSALLTAAGLAHLAGLL